MGTRDAAAVRVVFLGAGDAFGAGGRCMAAYLLEAPGSTILVDCGPTALLSLKRQGLTADAVDGIVVSHFHGDHFAGIPFLLLEYLFERPRRRPLTIAGPPGTEEHTRQIFSAMYPDLATRPLPFPIRYVDLAPDTPSVIAGTTVAPFRVPHQERGISLGFRLQVASRTILYSGDSGWTEAFVAQSRDADLFICECCFFETRVDFHLDYPRIAANRSRFGCRRLILTHIGREVLARLAEVGEEVGEDGLVVHM